MNLIIVFIIGAVLPLQISFNAILAKHITGVWAAATSSFVSAIFLVILGVVMRVPLPSLSSVSSAPAYVWLGGFIGALYVGGSAILAPKIGITVFLALVIIAQLIASAIIDHFGIFGFEQQTITLGRVAGLILLFVGFILVRKF